jgi:hypothetical protein
MKQENSAAFLHVKLHRELATHSAKRALDLVGSQRGAIDFLAADFCRPIPKHDHAGVVAKAQHVAQRLAAAKQDFV